MESERPLVFDIPHKAIRNILGQFSLMSGNINYNNEADLDKLKEIASETFQLLDSHAHHENDITLKYLEEKIQGGAFHDMEDHARIEVEMDKLAQMLKEISSMNGDRNFEGNNFFMQVSDFQAQYIQHMLEEERVTQPLIWKNFTDEEIQKMEIEIQTSISPDEMFIWAKYLMPALSLQGRKGMLAGMKAMFPEEFFNSMMKITESVISKEDFENLNSALK